MTSGLLGLPPPTNVVAPAATSVVVPAATSVVVPAATARVTPRRPSLPGLERIRVAVVGATVVFVAALTLALVVAPAFGYRVVTIRSGSMTPALRVGDLVVSRQVDARSATPGQIVTFRDPYLGQQLVTHRVVSVSATGTRLRFVTKGDANTVAEHWSIPPTGTIGRVVWQIPSVGWLVAPLTPPACWVVAISVVAASTTALVLRRIWRKDAPGRRAS